MASIFSEDAISLLDGGFGTTLEDVFGANLSTPLWSASLLNGEPSTVVAAHKAFLDAGADAILTSTYQCAFEAFRRAGHVDTDAVQLTRKAVRLASQAKEQFLSAKDENGSARKDVKIVLSLGPYGAILSPMQEFEGLYPPPYGPRGYTPDEMNTNAFAVPSDEGEHAAIAALEEFHLGRLLVFAGDDSDGSVWSLIDAIAFETVPLARELFAIRRAMGSLAVHLAARNLPMKPWWLSTVWPNGRFPQESSPTDKTPLSTEQVVRALLQDPEAELARPVLIPVPDGIGVNCTHVDDLDAVVCELRRAVQTIQLGRKPFLVLYPNGGIVYDIVSHAWINANTTAESHSAAAWATQVSTIAKRELASGVWGGVAAGGCCKAGPEHIRLLEKAVR
ncbi:hypothetical protein M0805_007702 [Coniferiporia weirii]|nr:hypothetical protein M0805_007702 [Coniferiporia weirii]